MRHINRYATAVLGLCLTVASFGAAADDAAGPDFSAIRAQQVELRAEVEAGNGIFSELSNAQRRELAGRQAELLAMIEGKQAISEFNDQEQVRVFNLLEEISASVTGAEDSQIVCEYTKKTGSHRKTKQCMTVAQKRKLQQDTEDALRKEFQRGYGKPNS